MLTSPRSHLKRFNTKWMNIYSNTWASYLCKLVTYNMTCTSVCLFVCSFGFAVWNISWCILGVPEDHDSCRVGVLWSKCANAGDMGASKPSRNHSRELHSAPESDLERCGATATRPAGPAPPGRHTAPV